MTRPTDTKADHDDEARDEAARSRAEPKGDKSDPDNGQSELGERLDEGLEETFPSSDPVSVKITK